ncbi:hypothetical protein GCM10007868_06760 [Gluconobacter frateurii]|uniref:Uncharacterized protein n=1 Tax=Gluconobacter frateurii NRIC 0228 TaxID=1307946 RepID=A0ABQ0QFR2_9PROT|nr:hypothetical protein AA0228_3024 [Gluconobacter frateurii NRIC 0228]GLP89601.1 hypothetical protein GCM10007868_06760 [Gluconobacter frateurii]
MLSLIQKFKDLTEQQLIECDCHEDTHIRVFDCSGKVSYFESDEMVFLFKNNLGYYSKMKYENYEIETDDGYTFLVYDREDNTFSYIENEEFQFSFVFEDGEICQL